MPEIAKISDWHERFAEWLILNPDKGLDEAAKAFNRSVPWLSTVRNSDAFQDHLKKLSAAHSSAVFHSVREKTLGLADQVITKLQERVELEGASIPLKGLLEIADVALKRTGHGEPGAVVGGALQVNIGVVDASVLQAARDRMRAKASVIELQAEPSVELERAALGGSS